MSSVAVCLMDAWNKTNAKAGVLGKKEKRLGQAVALFRAIEGEKFRLPHSTLKQVADSSVHGRNWLHANLGIEYSLEWPTVPDQGPVILDEVSASSIARLLLNLHSSISGYDRVVVERDRAKQEIKALRMRLDELKDERKLAKQRCQAVEKQVSQWNARSWITRAFHKLRLVK